MDENKMLNSEEVTENIDEVTAGAAEEILTETAEEEIAEAAEGTATEGSEETVPETAGDSVAEATTEEPDEGDIPDEKVPEKDTAGKIEEAVQEAAEELETVANDIVAKTKAVVEQGNVTYIRIRKEDKIILNLPMTVGIIGTVIGLAAAPWAVILATLATVGLKCTVEVEKKDGTIVTIHGTENKE